MMNVALFVQIINNMQEIKGIVPAVRQTASLFVFGLFSDFLYNNSNPIVISEKTEESKPRFKFVLKAKIVRIIITTLQVVLIPAKSPLKYVYLTLFLSSGLSLRYFRYFLISSFESSRFLYLIKSYFIFLQNILFIFFTCRIIVQKQ